MNTYICEVCGLQEDLTEKDAFSRGWDYPPFIGAWGVVSARTCPTCPMTATVWWKLVAEGVSYEDLSDQHKATLVRIKGETE